MPYIGHMILPGEETADSFSFENTRSGDNFIAWLDEETAVWTITRQGQSQSWKADIWGEAKLRDGTWFATAGTLPGSEAIPFKSRDAAFEWITNDRTE